MIYNRQTIALLMRLSKLVSGEFGVRLHLDDPEIVDKFSTLLGSGGSPEAQAVWRQVRDQLALDQEPVASTSQRVYRGQIIETLERSPRVATEPVPATDDRPRAVRIYRGRVVN